MPIRLHRDRLGGYEVLTLDDSDGCRVSCIPERSGYVHALQLGGPQLLCHYSDADAVTRNSGHRNLALLPFPNRLLEGTYTWSGRECRFPVNKPDTRSALHGFGPHARFTLDRVDLSREVAELTLAYLHRAGEHPRAYPFDVLFSLSLKLDTRARSFAWTLRAENPGDAALPVGLGWHPYFLLPGGRGAWRLELPPNRRVELRDAIPTGTLLPGVPADTGGPTEIDPTWDDCLLLAEGAERSVVLRGPEYGLRLDQGGTARYTQLYVPPDERSVAVEPMSCGVNAFRQNPSEVRVAPAEGISLSMTVTAIAGAA